MADLLVTGAAIGDVDVASVPAPLSTTGGGTEATALRVTIASDSTGVVSIDDNAGAITVDGLGAAGAVVANVGATINATATVTDIVAVLRNDTTVPEWVANADFNGTGWESQRIAKTFKAQNVVAIATETAVWTPAAGKKFRLMGGDVAISSNGTLTLRDNTAGTVIAAVQLAANVTVPLFGGNGGNGILSGAADRVLTATGPAGSSLIGTLFGTEE